MSRGAAIAAVQPTLVWSAPFGGNTPVIAADGTIYVVDEATDGSQPGMLTALSAAGEKKWAVKVGFGSTGASPAIGVDGSVFVTTADANLHVVRPDGTLSLVAPIASDPSRGSPLLGPGGTVYVPSKFELEAFDAAGAKLWSLLLADGPVSSPALGHDGNLFVTTSSHLHCVSPGGVLLWSREVANDSILSGALIGDSAIFVPSTVLGGSILSFAYDGTPLSATPVGGLPGTLALGPDGRILAPLVSKPTVVAVTQSGTLSASWDFEGKLAFQPEIVVDGNGNVFVPTTAPGLVGVIGGAPVSFGNICPGGAAKAVGAAMDGDGSIVLANHGNVCKLSMAAPALACPASGSSRVRVGNLSPAGGSLDVCIRATGGTFQGPLYSCVAGAGLPYRAISRELAVAPGTYEVKVIDGSDCNGPKIVGGIVSLDPGTTTSVLAFGGPGTGEPAIMHALRDDAAPKDGTIALRFVHGIHQLGSALDAGLTDAPTLPTSVSTPLFEGVSFVSAAKASTAAIFLIDAQGYATGVPPILSQNIGLSVAGTPTALLAAMADVSPANAALTLFGTGIVGSTTYPPALMLCDQGAEIGTLLSCKVL